MPITPVLTAIGIPIGINECIGDSLHTINSAFTALDFRTASLTPPTSSGLVIFTTISGGNIVIGGTGVTTTLSGTTIITGNLLLSSDAYFTQNLYVSGFVAASLLSSTGDLYVNGNGYIGGDLIVDGKITGSELSSTGDLTVDGNTWLKGDLDVLGDAHIHGKLTASELSSTGDLTVDGNTTLKGNLSVHGNSFLGDQCSDFTQIQGTLKLPCVNSQNAIEFNNEVTMFPASPNADGVTVSYQTNLFAINEDGLLIEKTDFNQSTPSGGIAIRNRGSNGVLDSKDAFTVRGNGKTGIGTWYPNKDLTVIGEISATKNVQFNQNLQVDGNTTLGNGGKLTTIKDNLNVINDVEINGDLLVDGNLTVLGTTTQLDTEVNITSAVDITNHGTTTALTVNQTGNNPVVHFKDDGVTAIFIDGAGTGVNRAFVGIRTTTPVTPFHVVGDSTFTGKIHGTLDVQFDQNLQVDGNTTLGNGGKLTTIKDNLKVINDVEINNDLTVLGTTTQLDTEVNITSAVDITNHGTTTALTVNQIGTGPVVHFKDDGVTAIFIDGAGTGANRAKVGIRTATPATPFHVVGESTFSDNVNFDNAGSNSRRITNIREVLRIDILQPGIYEYDPVPVKSFRDFLFDDPGSLVISTNFILSDNDHNRTYVCTNNSDRTITCPAGLRVGLQVSFIRAGTGKITFVNGAGATINSALNFTQLAFTNSAGTVYLGQTDTYYLFGDLLP